MKRLPRFWTYRISGYESNDPTSFIVMYTDRREEAKFYADVLIESVVMRKDKNNRVRNFNPDREVTE